MSKTSNFIFYITPSLNLPLTTLPLNELFACQNNLVPCWITHWCQNSKLKTFWIVRQTDGRTNVHTILLPFWSVQRRFLILQCLWSAFRSFFIFFSFDFFIYTHTHIRVGSKYEWHALLTDLIWKSCSWQRKKNSVKKRESESRKTSEPTSKYPHQQNIRNLLKERERTNWQLPANVDTKKEKESECWNTNEHKPPELFCAFFKNSPFCSVFCCCCLLLAAMMHLQLHTTNHISVTFNRHYRPTKRHECLFVDFYTERINSVR